MLKYLLWKIWRFDQLQKKKHLSPLRLEKCFTFMPEKQILYSDFGLNDFMCKDEFKKDS